MKTLLAVLFATLAFADTPPVPKVFKGMQGQKGQYQVEMLEGGGKSGAGQKMNVCTDNLLQRQGDGKGKRESSCKYRLLKDTADEATIESTCDGRTSTMNIKRESAKSMLMSVESTGAKGPQTMRMRYTHLGACREGQGAVTLDPNSEQCRKLKEQAAKMKDRETAARLSAMCS
jgi:hypothetical protein